MKTALVFVIGAVFFSVCHADIETLLQVVGEVYQVYVPNANEHQVPGNDILEPIWAYASKVWSQYKNGHELDDPSVKEQIDSACQQVENKAKKDKADMERMTGCFFFGLPAVIAKYSKHGGGAPGSSSKHLDLSLHLK